MAEAKATSVDGATAPAPPSKGQSQRLDLLFAAHCVTAAVCGAMALVAPSFFGIFFQEGMREQWGSDRPQISALHVVVRLYGALISGQALLTWFLRGSDDARTRKGAVVAYFLVFAATTAVLLGSRLVSDFWHPLSWSVVALFAWLAASYGCFVIFGSPLGVSEGASYLGGAVAPAPASKGQSQRLDLLFAAHCVTAAVCGAMALVAPSFFGIFFQEGMREQWGSDRPQISALHVVVRLYGALISGQALLTWFLRGSDDARTRKGSAVAYFLVFAATTAVLLGSRLVSDFWHPLSWSVVALFAWLTVSYGWFAVFGSPGTFESVAKGIM